MNRAAIKKAKHLWGKDVWETDEVFGDYLIEEMENKTIIYYFRFGKKFNKLELSELTKESRKEWIKKDIINQIIINSRIATRKYKLFKFAIWATTIGFILPIVNIIIKLWH